MVAFSTYKPSSIKSTARKKTAAGSGDYGTLKFVTPAVSMRIRTSIFKRHLGTTSRAPVIVCAVSAGCVADMRTVHVPSVTLVTVYCVFFEIIVVPSGWTTALSKNMVSEAARPPRYVVFAAVLLNTRSIADAPDVTTDTRYTHG